VVKSQQCLKLRIFELRFLRFLKAASKKRKKSRFFGFSKKNVKNVFSNYDINVTDRRTDGRMDDFDCNA